GCWGVGTWLERCVGRFCCASRRRHTRLVSDWSSDVCSSDLLGQGFPPALPLGLDGLRLLLADRGQLLLELRRRRGGGSRAGGPEIGRASCRDRAEVWVREDCRKEHDKRWLAGAWEGGVHEPE